MAYKKNMVSIIIPHYNYSDYMEQCLESILKQKYKKFEVIIIDDHSKEEEYNKMLNIVNQHSENIKINIFVHRNDKNLGLTLTRNEGVNKSQGEFILFLDPDDNIEEYFLSKTVKTLQENPEIGFAYVNTRYFGAANKVFSQPEYNFYRLINAGNFISYCSLIRRKAFIESGGFNLENWSYLEDYELWVKLSRKGWYGKLVPEVLFNYFVHEDSAIHSGFTSEAQKLFYAYFIKKYPELYPEQLQLEANKILKDVPENFMSLSKSENERWWNEWKKNH